MAAVTKRGEKFQVRVKHKLLQKPFFFTFDDENEARTYASKLEGLLDRGIVPLDLHEQSQSPSALLTTILKCYASTASKSDKEIISYLPAILDQSLRLSSIDSRWADKWVETMKSKRMAPGTIRKRVGALARAIDSHIRLLPPGSTIAHNPLRMMPLGYSQYNGSTYGDTVPIDTERDRTLSQEELARADDALQMLASRKSGRHIGDKFFSVLFWLIYHTGLRLRAAYTLEVNQIDRSKNLIVFKDRGRGNKRKPRFVPIHPKLRQILYPCIEGRLEGIVFPYWNGEESDLSLATHRLTQRFMSLFKIAKIEDFTEHDLRHCATTNWLEMKTSDGRWLFSETEVIKIMGWTSSKMLLRYASIRGEDLSGRFD